ncbi:MAG TPA: hypothetical protein VNI60_01340, partial [Pyrinomonadaceae bacterium]|nr:hypothetical protein [Pyrinomonadaceae bacterium]
VGYRTGDHTGSSVPVTAEGTGALLFYGYYDQTDIFFKMAKVLSMNTQPLDAALNFKRSVDVPYFTPDYILRPNESQRNSDSLPQKDSIQWMKNAPLFAPRLITEKDHAAHDEEHQVP